ncbi:MAG: hypothetical protein AAB288_09265, partial [Acidobacteriota bacterium]
CNYQHRYEIRGRLIVPDVIGVMDGLAGQQMVRAGIPRRRLAIVGHPILEPSPEKKKRAMVRRCSPQASDGRRVLFLSEPISWNGKLSPRVVRYSRHNEMTVLRNLLAVFEKNADLRAYSLHIRPHPLEPLSRLKTVLRQYAPPDLRVTIDRSRPLEKDLDSARVVLGITSIALLQALLAGRPVLSLHFAPARGRIPDDILCFLPRIRSRGSFIQAVSHFIRARRTNGKWHAAARWPRLPRHSSVRIAREIEKLLKRK